MTVVKVSLGERSYSILIGERLLAALGEHCKKLGLDRRCAVITDARVAPKFGKAAIRALRGAGIAAEMITIP
ncbi:MAG TPA: 3-dehydroquinate synthase, partial [Verrucomicrobiae bacterium]